MKLLTALFDGIFKALNRILIDNVVHNQLLKLSQSLSQLKINKKH